MGIKERVRALFPPHGVQYELFDTSVLLLAFGLVGYIITDPPANTAEALQAPLRFISETGLGFLMTAAAVVGIVTSYSRKWCRVGYIATATMAGVLALNFLVGLLTTNADDRTVLSVILYAWIARRLLRDNRDEQVAG